MTTICCAVKAIPDTEARIATRLPARMKPAEAACMGGAIILVCGVIATCISLLGPGSPLVSIVKAAVLTALTTPNSPCRGGPAGTGGVGEVVTAGEAAGEAAGDAAGEAAGVAVGPTAGDAVAEGVGVGVTTGVGAGVGV